jgi:hypothetical protein
MAGVFFLSGLLGIYPIVVLITSTDPRLDGSAVPASIVVIFVSICWILGSFWLARKMWQLD